MFDKCYYFLAFHKLDPSSWMLTPSQRSSIFLLEKFNTKGENIFVFLFYSTKMETCLLEGLTQVLDFALVPHI